MVSEFLPAKATTLIEFDCVMSISKMQRSRITNMNDKLTRMKLWWILFLRFALDDIMNNGVTVAILVISAWFQNMNHFKNSIIYSPLHKLVYTIWTIRNWSYKSFKKAIIWWNMRSYINYELKIDTSKRIVDNSLVRKRFCFKERCMNDL